ncbi:hypothetical protein K7W42_04760 [Deinococcus sp. HMF7604]|uniref:hypothetical protein n=1 Tax=Deinococcus betulae TaxID=2873312 RepID=UPI001CC96F7B|nr:hypothetical protein [Deinococcus betulae]MBZ9750169.1 hypothetical protein [Deinococcus betulae]
MTALQGSSLPEGTVTVWDEAQAAVITTRTELRRLSPFMGRACTVTQAATALGLGVTATYKLVQRYVRLGLVWESHCEERAGRALRFYQAPPAFYVPFSVRPFEEMGRLNRAAQLHEFEQNLQRAMNTRAWTQWGTLTCATPAGDWYYEFVSQDGRVFQPQADESPRILAGWNRVSMTSAEAQTLQQQLLALVRPYFNRPEQGETYQLGVFLSPERVQ